MKTGKRKGSGLTGLKRDVKRPKTIRAPDGPQHSWYYKFSLKLLRCFCGVCESYISRASGNSEKNTKKECFRSSLMNHPRTYTDHLKVLEGLPLQPERQERFYEALKSDVPGVAFSAETGFKVVV
ncbi:hypothetical protein NQ318_015397 [Aromia moschata]|uniref:Uncharacterized protein n=1 Tax=Aromia moschata TaxID=1265417 RepID=A0AAV8YQT4_9CUCU|nr:hypothetical protein NQ318_015397 [Aromia moschata]